MIETGRMTLFGFVLNDLTLDNSRLTKIIKIKTKSIIIVIKSTNRFNTRFTRISK